MVLAEVGGSAVLECELEKSTRKFYNKEALICRRNATKTQISVPAETSLVWKRRVAESSYFELLFIGDFLFSPELDGRFGKIQNKIRLF